MKFYYQFLFVLLEVSPHSNRFRGNIASCRMQSKNECTGDLSSDIAHWDDCLKSTTMAMLAPTSTSLHLLNAVGNLGIHLKRHLQQVRKFRSNSLKTMEMFLRGNIWDGFSTSTKQFKIAINMGNISKTLELKNQSKVILQKVEVPLNKLSRFHL